jgi:aminoglycoside/choline kinase family phosphotransferase
MYGIAFRPEASPDMSIDILKQLFERHFGVPATSASARQRNLGASGRNILRLNGNGQTAIGILYTVRAENVAFLEFSRHFRRHGLPVPEIYGEDLEHNVYLEEDLGNTTLFESLSENRNGDDIAPHVIGAYRKAIAVLPRFQVDAGRTLDYQFAYPRASFDGQSIAWDLNYFKYYFLRLAGIDFNEQGLEDDFHSLTEFLLGANRENFLYRDFQSRNIMLRDGEPWFLDYQGGRKGALQYDIASLLYDAKADLPPGVRQHLLEYYLDDLAKHIALDREEFLRYYYGYVYVRIMQALGAYGFRGFYERKPLFLQSIPYALKNLGWLQQNVELPIALPGLTGTFRAMLASDTLLSFSARKSTGLLVRINSFSFHRGAPPQDDGGNGGGFVFDARSLPNPGREECFKALTGRDAAVVEYLNRHQSVHQYFHNVASLIDAAVENYRSRGFHNLMVSFGCTGGQHRSVYLASRLAEHLHGKGVEVELRHIELEKILR